jgi:hypothetical protein
LEKQFVSSIVRALVTENMAAGLVLPELNRLSLYGYRDSPSVAKAAEKFVTTRRLSGHAIHLSG